MSRGSKINCWEYYNCKYSPDSNQPCPAASDETSDGVNWGNNAGRICWTLPDTLCFDKPMGQFSEKREICFSCNFFQRVKKEGGNSFHLFKLAQGVKETRDLHTTISQMEHLIELHDILHYHFNLNKSLMEIIKEARKLTGAQRSIVFLIKGDPPALHGEFSLRGKVFEVAINIDDNSAVGYAAAHNQVVNLQDVYNNPKSLQSPIFNKSFDKQCNCKTQSLLAVPIHDSEKRVIGVINVANAKNGFFSADDEWFLHMYATEVALAVEKRNFLHQSLSSLRLVSISETVAGLSHCIKNIAHVLRASSYIMKRAIASNNVKDIKTTWEILDRHVESLANLSLDILTFKPVPHRSRKDTKLNDVIRHIVNLFQEEARARAITLKMHLGKKVGPCSFDTRGIYRCLVNIITNAFNACPLSNGEVMVSTKRIDEKELMISVTDNGVGMEKNTIEEAFDLFKTSKPERGSGLGLPTVAEIVKEYNGRIEIDTKSGKGTTFKLYFQEFS